MKLAKADIYSQASSMPVLKFEEQQLTSFAGLIVFQKLFENCRLRERLHEACAHLVPVGRVACQGSAARGAEAGGAGRTSDGAVATSRAGPSRGCKTLGRAGAACRHADHKGRNRDQ